MADILVEPGTELGLSDIIPLDGFDRSQKTAAGIIDGMDLPLDHKEALFVNYVFVSSKGTIKDISAKHSSISERQFITSRNRVIDELANEWDQLQTEIQKYKLKNKVKK